MSTGDLAWNAGAPQRVHEPCTTTQYLREIDRCKGWQGDSVWEESPHMC